MPVLLIMIFGSELLMGFILGKSFSALGVSIFTLVLIGIGFMFYRFEVAWTNGRLDKDFRWVLAVLGTMISSVLFVYFLTH
jgi:cation transport ATPase